MLKIYMLKKIKFKRNNLFNHSHPKYFLFYKLKLRSFHEINIPITI